jgi:hypothetical protein
MGFSDLLAVADGRVRSILGESVVYTPGDGDPETVTGVFDAAYQVVGPDKTQVSSSGPAVFLTLADLPSDPSVDLDATVTIAGTTYRVREPRPDGLGAVLLLLHED